jgi:hypothetical protein
LRHRDGGLPQREDPDPSVGVEIQSVQPLGQGWSRGGRRSGRSVEIGQEFPAGRQACWTQNRYLVKKFTKCYGRMEIYRPQALDP